MGTKSKHALLAAHFVLMLLACTNLTIVTWAWGNHTLSWNFWQYSYSHGWGYRYASDYSLIQVVLYLGAYGTGLLVLSNLKCRPAYLSGLAMVVCAVGMASFALEFTHWLWEHNLSLIGSFPSILAILWVCIAVQISRDRKIAHQAS